MPGKTLPAVPATLWDCRRYRIALFARGLSNEDLCKETGLSRAHLSYVLRGLRPVTPDVMERLRRALGEAGWAYMTRQTETLPTEEVK